MDMLNNGSSECPSTPDLPCSICLNVITNKCYSNSCSHLYCFNCLESWSNVCLQQSPTSEPTCPSCRRTFRHIYYSFDNPGFFVTYDVPIMPRLPILMPRRPGRPFRELFSRVVHLNNVRANHENMDILPRIFVTDQENLAQIHRWPTQNYPQPSTQRPLDGQAIRTEVYITNVWALPLSDPAGHFRHYTSDFYRNNPTEIHRLRSFIIRDLVAIRESVRFGGLPMPFPDIRDVIGANVIIGEIRMFGLQHLRYLQFLRPILNTRAEHFCHELNNFLYSPYEISDYDRYVEHMDYLLPANSSRAQIYQMYHGQPPPIHNVDENVVQDSDDREFQNPNIIEALFDREQLPSTLTIAESIALDLFDEGFQRPISTDGSDVEIPSQSNRSTDPHEWNTVDQPSTSTGIRDSLVRPNNSSQSVHGGLSRVSYSSQVKRGSSDLDSSSDDEESIFAALRSENARLKSLDANKKKKN